MLIRPPVPEDDRPPVAGAKVRATLEYDKVVALLAEHATNTMGRSLALALEPSSDLERVCRAQRETTEARAVLRSPKELPLGGIHDVRPHVHRALIGSVLAPAELLEIHDTVHAATRMRRFLAEFTEVAPLLAAIGEDLGDFRSLEQAIGAAIGDQAQVLDGASRDLLRIRRDKRIFQDRVRDKLDNLVRSEVQRYLQEPIVTLRGDRFVVPVKQEFRAQVPGIVHDQSASGQTLFVEPLAVLELNNRLRELELEEQEEIQRILRELTALVAAAGTALGATVTNLGRLDFIFAKGKYADATRASEPLLNDRGEVNLIRARHPLLRGEVVPVDVPLGRDFDVMLVTGPNTGGKTVALKTLGLTALMAMSGLHLPAASGSEMSTFSRVFADIGDEQSIEQSLSTFSSHMTNIVRIVRDLDRRSLVLLDEVGAGTDPVEGAALAMALLEHLAATGARVIATTHYGALKAFAYSRPRVANASVEFDPDSLRPTYHLVVGLPGRSNAFVIASRLGLPEELVARAREFLSRDDVKIEDLIESMETDRFVLERERMAAENLRAGMEATRAELDHQVRDIRREEGAILEKAREQALRIIQRARAEADEALRLLRAAGKETRVQERQRALEDARRTLRDAHGEAAGYGQAGPADAAAGGEPAAGAAGGSPRPGQMVFIRGLGQKGTVLSVHDGQAMIRVGIMKVQRPVSDLAVLVEEAAGETWGGTTPGGGRAGAASGLAGQKALTFSPEIDLRGLTVEEAAYQLDKYLDDAGLAGVPRVHIIHGKGTGALRKGLLEWLSGDRRVKSHRPGGHGEGGMGVTIAELAE
jgi:DNA mismatch repair protein MutS2